VKYPEPRELLGSCFLPIDGQITHVVVRAYSIVDGGARAVVRLLIALLSGSDARRCLSPEIYLAVLALALDRARQDRRRNSWTPLLRRAQTQGPCPP